LTPAPSKLRALALATRPRTLGASLVPVLVGSALARAQGAFEPRVLAACALAALSLQVAANLANDALDFARGVDTPERLGPPRATAQGWLSQREVLAATATALAVALAAGIGLVARGGWPILAIGLGSLAGALLYSAGPFALAARGLGELAAFGFFGLIAVAGTHYLHTGRFEPRALAAAVPVGALVANLMLVNNLRDRDGDARAGKRTLVVRIGAARGRALYAALVGIAFACTALVAWRIDAGAWLAFATAPLALVAAREVVAARSGSDHAAQLLPAARLHAVFGALYALGIAL
jgi:1,4-dihydroxy-2-naphthoate octaprenyltransferase